MTRDPIIECICDEVTKAIGGSLINCPAHGSSWVLGMVNEIDRLKSHLAAKDTEIAKFKADNEAVLSEIEYARKERAEFYAKVQFLDKGLVEVEAERDALREGLRRLQYVIDGSQYVKGGVVQTRICAVCYESNISGHAKDCWLAALLGEAEEE